jgi:NADP-reducing hydrogenase subunit HndB
MPKLTIDELKKMRESVKKDIFLREGNFKGKIIVHMGTCGIAAGAREIMNILLDELAKKNITDIILTSSGCAGLCSEEPMITVEISGTAPIKYGKLTSDKIKKIFNDHIFGGIAVNELVLAIGSERVG